MKIRNYCTRFKKCDIFVSCIVVIFVLSVTVTVVVIVVNFAYYDDNVSIAVHISVAFVVGYCKFSNSAVNIFCTVITVNTIVTFSVTTINFTEYVIILISVIIGVGNGGIGGWFILIYNIYFL